MTNPAFIIVPFWQNNKCAPPAFVHFLARARCGRAQKAPGRLAKAKRPGILPVIRRGFRQTDSTNAKEVAEWHTDKRSSRYEIRSFSASSTSAQASAHTTPAPTATARHQPLCRRAAVKGVVDMYFVGVPFGHGNSLSDNSAGRQHFLPSPLDCLSAKAGGAAGGGAYAPFVLTARWLGWLCYYSYKLPCVFFLKRI